MEMSPISEDILPIILKQLFADADRGCSHCYSNYHHQRNFNLVTILRFASLTPSPAELLSPFLISDNIWKDRTPQIATRLLRRIANGKAPGEMGFIPKTRVSTLWVELAASNLKELNLGNLSRLDSPIDVLKILKQHNAQLHRLNLPSLQEHSDHLIQTTVSDCLLPSRHTLRELTVEVNGLAETNGLQRIRFTNLTKLHIKKPRNGLCNFGEPVWWIHEVDDLLANLYDSGSRLQFVSVSRIHHRHLALPRIAILAPTAHTVNIHTQTSTAAEVIGRQDVESLNECFGNTKHLEFSGQSSIDIFATWKRKLVLPQVQTISVLYNGHNRQQFCSDDPVASVETIGHLITKLELGPNFRCLTSSTLEHVLSKCPNLKELKIHIAYCDVPILGNYLSKASNLQNLTVRFYMFRNEDNLKGFGTHIAECLLQGRSHLEHLEIDCLHLTQEVVKKLLVRFGTSLTCLKVAAASEDTPSGLDLTEKDAISIFETAIKHCQKLECLDIWDRDDVVDIRKMSKRSFETINRAYRVLPKLGYVCRPRLVRLA